MEDWTSLGQHKRKPEFPIITRESRRNSRTTTWLPRHRIPPRNPAGVMFTSAQVTVPPSCLPVNPEVVCDPVPAPFSLQLRRDSRVTAGNSGFLLCWPRKVQSSIRVARESWGLLSSRCRANRPHLGLCPGNNIPLQGRQGSWSYIPDSPGESGQIGRAHV